jgi:cellulose synthase (UDP-forming)
MSAVVDRVTGTLGRVLLPPAAQDRRTLRLWIIRILVTASTILGVYYIAWRWTSSLNMAFWWIAIPLVIAETYSILDAALFGGTVWRLKERGEAPPPPDVTVDVFITTYNEPIDLVMTTAIAARDIAYPHTTWVLDDGARPEMQAAAESAGIGYIKRSDNWADKPRHAKAGNLNNALFATQGEFMLILDADQIPDPQLLHRTLGWFTDDRIALVQTPQYFTNVPEADPLGSQAPLFYGPIQQGKDGWDAAFFCGSNAVLRREALMQLGVVGYVKAVDQALRRALRAADTVLATARRTAQRQGNDAAVVAVDAVAEAVIAARADLARGEPISEITYAFQRAVDAASADVVSADLDLLQADLAALGELPIQLDAELAVPVVDESALRALAGREWSPLGALEGVAALVRAVDVDLGDEAQPVMPLATISVTEDMATAMRLHGMGWRSVYHHEVLAYGLAPEDLGSMLHQRLRWAQGTLQVLLRENPLVQRGLTWGQRIMYFSTMWTYLSGFAALVYVAAPILYLLFDVRPVDAYGREFFWHLVPYLVVNQLVFLVVGFGVKTWRGQQYNLALFPIWIRAVTTAIGNVYGGRSLGFVVTPKTRQEGGPPWRLVRPQLIAMGLLAAAILIGLTRLAVGAAADPGGVAVNVIWAVYDLVIFSVIIDAALYRGIEDVDA